MDRIGPNLDFLIPSKKKDSTDSDDEGEGVKIEDGSTKESTKKKYVTFEEVDDDEDQDEGEYDDEDPEDEDYDDDESDEDYEDEDSDEDEYDSDDDKGVRRRKKKASDRSSGPWSLRNWKVWLVIVLVICLPIIGILISIDEPEVEVQSISLPDPTTVTQGYLKFDLTLKVYSDNFFNAKLTRLRANIFVNDQDIGDATTNREFEIPGGQAAIIIVELTIDNIPSLSPDELFKPRITAIGTADIEVAFMDFSIDFTHDV